MRWVMAGLFLLVMEATAPVTYAQNPVACGATVTVQPGDTLSLIAARQSGSQTSYQAIVAATNAQAAVDNTFTAIADPNVLSVGWKLCIPAGGAAGVSVPATLQNRLLPTATPASLSAAALAAGATPLI
jgi:LysM repeat protein